jgi:hypothetical protein
MLLRRLSRWRDSCRDRLRTIGVIGVPSAPSWPDRSIDPMSPFRMMEMAVRVG